MDRQVQAEIEGLFDEMGLVLYSGSRKLSSGIASGVSEA